MKLDRLTETCCSWTLEYSFRLTRSFFVVLDKEYKTRKPFLVLMFIAGAASHGLEWESTCVTDNDGVPRLALENHSHLQIIFTLECDQTSQLVYVEAETTYNHLVFFHYMNFDDGSCVLQDHSPTTHGVKVYAHVVGADYIHDRFNYSWCSTTPGIEERTQVTTDCRLTGAGRVRYSFINHMYLPLTIQFHCFGIEWNGIRHVAERRHYGIQMSPRTRAELDIKYHSPENPEHSDCFLLPDEDGFYYFSYNIFTEETEYRIQAVLYCDQRHDTFSPIVDIIAHCPPTLYSVPYIELRADFPAYGIVHCKNGDAHLSSNSQTSAVIDATFYQGHTHVCQFYKQTGALTFSILVEVGWGVADRELFLESKVETITCVYDDFANSQSAVESIDNSFLPPKQVIIHQGNFMQDVFHVRILDVLDRQIHTANIAHGQRIRLRITEDSDSVAGFKALSCTAHNGVTSYNILSNGCGDGFIIDRNRGFLTKRNIVYSPFFEAFKLRGGKNIWFDCLLTNCEGYCDGDSCSFVGDGPVAPVTSPTIPPTISPTTTQPWQTAKLLAS